MMLQGSVATTPPIATVVSNSFVMAFLGAVLIAAGCRRDLPGSRTNDDRTGGHQDVRALCANDRGVRVLSIKEPSGEERITLENGSAFVHVLPGDSRRVQDEVKAGVWLLYIWAPWNTYEAAELAVVADAAEALSQTAKVGARTYIHYSDISDLHLGPHTSPRWVVMSNGRILGEQSGFLTRDNVVAFVQRSIAAESKQTR